MKISTSIIALVLLAFCVAGAIFAQCDAGPAPAPGIPGPTLSTVTR